MGAGEWGAAYDLCRYQVGFGGMVGGDRGRVLRDLS